MIRDIVQPEEIDCLKLKMDLNNIDRMVSQNGVPDFWKKDCKQVFNGKLVRYPHYIVPKDFILKILREYKYDCYNLQIFEHDNILDGVSFNFLMYGLVALYTLTDEDMKEYHDKPK